MLLGRFAATAFSAKGRTVYMGRRPHFIPTEQITLLVVGPNPRHHGRAISMDLAGRCSWRLNAFDFENNLRNLRVISLQTLEYFDRVISPIARFAAGHRTVYWNDLHNIDVAYRRLLRSIVGPARTLPAWSSSHLADSIQIMIGNLFWTPLAFGTIFRDIIWASSDQNGIGLATRKARGCWPWRGLVSQFETMENLGAILLFRTAPM